MARRVPRRSARDLRRSGRRAAQEFARQRAKDPTVTWQRNREDDRCGAVLAGVFSVAALGIYSGFTATNMNNYVWEADGWLRGYTYLPHFPGDYIDAIPFHGRAYVYEAPFPAVLLLPFVAVWGLSTNQTLLAIGLAAIGIGVAWLVARRIGVSPGWASLLAAFLLFGASYSYVSANGDVWFVAQSGSVAFTMLALAECLGRREP